MATTWRQLIAQELSKHDENWTYIIGKTITDEELELETNITVPFTVWTAEWVYFPAYFEGDADDVDYHVASVPRNVCDEKVWPMGVSDEHEPT